MRDRSPTHQNKRVKSEKRISSPHVAVTNTPIVSSTSKQNQTTPQSPVTTLPLYSDQYLQTVQHQQLQIQNQILAKQIQLQQQLLQQEQRLGPQNTSDINETLALLREQVNGIQRSIEQLQHKNVAVSTPAPMTPPTPATPLQQLKSLPKSPFQTNLSKSEQPPQLKSPAQTRIPPPIIPLSSIKPSTSKKSTKPSSTVVSQSPKSTSSSVSPTVSPAIKTKTKSVKRKINYTEIVSIFPDVEPTYLRSRVKLFKKSTPPEVDLTALVVDELLNGPYPKITMEQPLQPEKKDPPEVSLPEKQVVEVTQPAAVTKTDEPLLDPTTISPEQRESLKNDIKAKIIDFLPDIEISTTF